MATPFLSKLNNQRVLHVYTCTDIHKRLALVNTSWMEVGGEVATLCSERDIQTEPFVLWAGVEQSGVVHC